MLALFVVTEFLIKSVEFLKKMIENQCSLFNIKVKLVDFNKIINIQC